MDACGLGQVREAGSRSVTVSARTVRVSLRPWALSRLVCPVRTVAHGSACSVLNSVFWFRLTTRM